MNHTVYQATAARRLLEFHYDGGRRTVESYCHGVNANGRDLLRAYQVSGFSRSGSPTGWRLFDLGKISGLVVLDGTVTGGRPGYNPSDSDMTMIYCRV